jgi:cell division protein FtsZ
MTLFEVDEATNRIREDVDNDANIIFGATFDERLEGRIRVSVVATGIGLTAEEELTPEPEPVAPKDEPLMGVGNMLRKSFGAHAFSAHNNLYAAPPSELEEAPAHENCAFVSEEYQQEEPPRRYVEEVAPQRNGVSQNAHQGQNSGRYPYQNIPQQTKRPSLLERLTRSSRRANYEGTQRPDAMDQDSVDIPAFLLRDKNTKK